MSQALAAATANGAVSLSVDTNGSLDTPQYAAAQIADKRMGRNNARQNAVASGALPEESFANLDGATYEPFRDTVKLWSFFESRDLTRQYDINDQLITWQIRDDEGETSVDMDIESAADELSLNFGWDGAAMPIIHIDYSNGFREGVSPGAPMQPDDDIPTMKTQTAGRLVGETAERMILGNPGGAGPADGITVPFRNQDFGVSSLTDPTRVNTATLDADWETDLTQVRKTFKRLRYILKHDNRVGAGNTGYVVWLGETYFDILDTPDPEGNGNMYIRDRVDDLSNIEMIDELDFLPEKSILMMRPTADVFELGVAQNPQTTQWTVNPWRDKWKTHAAVSPMPKVTTSGQSGIVYAEP